MEIASAVVIAVSILVPAKTWFAPEQPVEVMVQTEQPVRLVMTDFVGTPMEPQGSVEIDASATVNLREIFTQLEDSGTYLLYAMPADGGEQFLGTPLVIGVRADRRRAAPQRPMVIKVEPLRYAVIDTEHGQMTVAFYYDDAPNTVAHFLSLAEGGFYDGLAFHRIVPGFVIQSGDPLRDNTGGPGYMIQAEFNDRPHVEGVLSMARSGDPQEAAGAMPRPEFANSAGSQFFICLDYAQTRQLDRRYTAFGKVVEGMEAAQAIAQVPLADRQAGRPQTPQVIRGIEVRAVTAENNPYDLLDQDRAIPGVPGPVGQ